jgi:hypothetical protein
MATALQANDILQLRSWSTHGAQACVTTLNYRILTVGGSPATDQDAVTAFEALQASDYKAVMANGATYNGSQARIIRPGVVPATVNETGQAGAGTGGGNQAASQIRGLIQWQTAFGGPRYRGRIYMPFPSTANTDSSGQPNNTLRTAYQTLAAVWEAFASVSASGRTCTQQLVIYHRGFTPNYTEVVDHTSPFKFATQRKSGAFGRANISPI